MHDMEVVDTERQDEVKQLLLGNIAEALKLSSCAGDENGWGKCFDRDAYVGEALKDYNVEGLCLDCRAHWHLNMAVNALHGIDVYEVEPQEEE